MKSKVLIIDDEKDICFLISEILNDENFITESANNSNEAIEKFNTFKPDLIILDVWLGNSDLDGLELLIKFKNIDKNIPIIVISGHGTVDMAVNAIKNGAYDFLEKPFNSEKIIILTKRALENANLLKENIELKKISISDTPIIGNSNFITNLNKSLKKISLSSSRVLITGPTGVGKKLISKTIHKLSRRNNSLANIIDFSNLDELFLNDIFTEDSNNLKNNIFFKSNNGTLIMENIEKMNLEIQKKLLFFLENDNFFKDNNVNINVKIISLSSKNLYSEIDKGNFRKDLFYRLNVIPIHVPAIILRRKDIIPICNFYLNFFNKNNKHKFSFSDNSIIKLESYDWPGNVSQIINYIERLVILNQEKNLLKDFIISNLPKDMGEIQNSSLNIENISLPLKDARENFEKEYLLSQIKRFNGNMTKISDFTGMERTALYRKIKSLNIDINKK